MSDLKRYYDDEMFYLRTSGRQFAQEYPDAARVLDGESQGDRDPAVERLLEGFAFLTARIRQEMDQDESGLARDLVEMTEPALLQPLPSFTMAELQPPAGESQQRKVERGALFSTVPLPGLGYPCLFSSDDARPLSQTELSGVSLAEGPDGHDQLELNFQRNASARTSAESLALYVHGDSGLAWTLWYFMVRCSESPVAPYRAVDTGNSWELCRSFFTMEERFRMVRLDLPEFEGNHTVRIRFNRKFPRHLLKAVQKDTLRINVFPLLNQFVQPTEPIVLDQRHFEYHIQPRQGRRQEIIKLRSVKAGSMKDPGRAKEILPFAAPGIPDKLPGQSYYRFATRANRQGENSAWIALGSLPPDTEMLSIEALCSDGPWVREHVQAKDIQLVKDPALSGCAVHALQRPTQLLRPPSEQDLEWRVLGLLGTGIQSLANPDFIKRALALWNWDPMGTKNYLIDNIRQASHSLDNKARQGKILPCVKVSLLMQDDKCQADSYDRLGQLFAFGNVLHHLFQTQATINTLVELEIVLEPSRLNMVWNACEGTCSPV
jgi:type VI secretion system protein ImpG